MWLENDRFNLGYGLVWPQNLYLKQLLPTNVPFFHMKPPSTLIGTSITYQNFAHPSVLISWASFLVESPRITPVSWVRPALWGLTVLSDGQLHTLVIQCLGWWPFIGMSSAPLPQITCDYNFSEGRKHFFSKCGIGKELQTCNQDIWTSNLIFIIFNRDSP